MRVLCFIFLIINCTIPVWGSFKGEPLIKNFTNAEYKGGSRIYSAVCTIDGLLFAGDKSGVLEYDGENWRKIECGFPVTSMCIDANEIVYVAGSKGIGKLERNAVNEHQFTSLQHYFSEIHSDNLRFSKVFSLGKEVVFVLGNEILVITPDRLRIIESLHNFQYYQKINNELYLYSPQDGVYKFKDSELESVGSAPEIKNLKVIGFYRDTNALHLVTEQGNIFEISKNGVKQVAAELSDFISDVEGRSIIQLNDSVNVLTTYYQGFLTFSADGRILEKYHYERGLINNTVFDVFEDRWGNLWVGTASGIAAIRQNLPLSIFNRKEGIGTGYSAQSLNGDVYLGTSDGLFLKEAAPEKKGDYKKLFEGHIFGLHKIGSTIYFGHATGFYQLKNNKPVILSLIPGGWDLKEIPWWENHFLCTTVNGLMLYHLSANGVLQELKPVDNTKWADGNFVFANDNFLWAESKHGVTRFTLNSSSTGASDIEHFDRISTGNSIRKVRKIKGELFFIADSGIYRFNPETQNFIETEFNAYLRGTDLKPTNMFASHNGVVWVFTHKNLIRFEWNGKEYRRKHEGVLKFADAHYPTYYENIYEPDSNYILMGLEQGFLCWQRNTKYVGPYSSVSFRKIQLRTADGEVKDIWGDLDLSNNAFTLNLKEAIPFKENSLKFYYAAGCSNYNEVRYQSFLFGYDESWTDWSTEHIREFTNLAPGKYRFVIRSINETEEFSYIARCDFEILSPWYLSKISMLIYAIVLIVLIILFERYLRYRVKRLQYKNRKKQENIRYREEQEQKQKELENEKELIRLKNEKLKTDIRYKSKELADSTMNVIEKNRFLTEVKTELEEVKLLSEKNKLVTTDIAKVIRKINKGIDNEENWKAFEDYFDSVHENFFKKMKKEFPILTAKDLRLCAYLRMNLSTKEIAPLLNISVRGVEISRYRLRKKMALKQDENLIDFLLKI